MSSIFDLKKYFYQAIKDGDASKINVTATISGAASSVESVQDTAADLNATVIPGTGWDASGVAKEAGGNLAASATVLGATTGAALDTDGTGTIQQYLRGLLKAFLARIPTDPAKESGKITDAVAALGATTGAAVNSDADGTIQQYLRGLIKAYADIWDSTNHVLKVGQDTASTLKCEPSQSDASSLHATVDIDSSRREVILHSEQLLPGASGGVLQAILGSVGTLPTVDDDSFSITDGAATHTWTFKAARGGENEVAIGDSAAETQTNLVAAIVADSALWTAVETNYLGRFFATNPSKQMLIHRRAISGNNDRVFADLTTANAIKIVSFNIGGYGRQDSTEANAPATDPAVKTFGFERDISDLSAGEKHHVLEDSLTYAFNADSNTWRFVFDESDIVDALWQCPGTSVYLALTAASAELAADLPPGKYVLLADTDVTFLISPSGGGYSAVWKTAPGILWPAGVPFYLVLTSAKRIAGITGGADGDLMVARLRDNQVI